MKYVLIAGIGIVIIFLAVLSFIPIGIEPLTEVYFENHTKLPKYLFTDRDYNFTFTVHNLEYQKMQYNYKITGEDENTLIEFDSGEFVLENNESISIFQSFSLDKGFDKMKIKTEIEKTKLETPEFETKLWWPDPNLENITIDIHFLVEEIKPIEIIITPD